MAEFDCFLTRDEFATTLERAFDDGFGLCLNKNMPRPQHEYVKTKKAIRPLLEAGQHAFILERGDISRYPVQLRPIEREGKQFWYPRPKEGGPVIETYFFAPFTKDGDFFVPPSLIAFSPKIVSPITGHEETAGKEIKDVYDRFIASIRKGSKRVQSKRQTAYVSPGVQAMVRAGSRLAPPFETKAMRTV